MNEFIRLSLVNYLISEGETTVRALQHDVIIRTKFIECVCEGDIPPDDFGFEGADGTTLMLNDDGVEFFENHFFSVKENICRVINNSVLALESLDEIEMKLGLVKG